VNAAGAAVKARIPVRPKAPASANTQPITHDFDPTEDRTMTHETAGYMVAGA
jgi:hypothetical protein